MQPIVDPLSSEEIKRRTLDNFPGVYLTFISIIQGVALGILASNTFQYVTDTKLANEWIRFTPYSFMSFVLLIIVAFDYTWFVGIFRWPPSIRDIIVPFTLGASELSPMFFLTNAKTWWGLTAIFCFVGALAFANTLYNCKPTTFVDACPYERTKRTLYRDIRIALMATLICTIAWALSSWHRFYWYLEIPFIAVFLLLGAVMLWRDEKFMTDLLGDFGFTR